MTSQIKLYVDKIITYGDKGANYAVVDTPSKIKNILPLVIRDTDLPIILDELTKTEEAIYYLDRFCQFIFLLELKKNFGGGQLMFFDCINETDIALDLYNDLSKDGWITQPKNEFMTLFQEIQLEYSTIQCAELSTD